MCRGCVVAALHNGHIHESAPQTNGQQRDRADAWWSIGEFTDRGRLMTHQSAKLTLTGNRVFGHKHAEEVWDLSDSLAELYEASAPPPPAHAAAAAAPRGLQQTDVTDWLSRDVAHGFIRVYPPDMSCFVNSQLMPLTLSTTAHKVCLLLGLAVNALHVQLSGDKVRRLDPDERPLAIQHHYLATLGYTDVTRIQEEGAKEELAYLVKFYSGSISYM